MKICYLADGESIHTKRWCAHFASLGHEIHLITFRNCNIPDTTVHFIHTGKIDTKGRNWKIIFSIWKIRKLIRKIRPDILHSHYATSYGLVGAASKFHPFVVTALGTDILISPVNSIVYRKVLFYVFKKADWITAMSDYMRERMIELGSSPEKTSTIIFGIDTAVFNLQNHSVSADKFIITSTRNFEPVYNIPHLIESFAEARKMNSKLQLNLIGDGTMRKGLEEVVVGKNLSDSVRFFGKVSQGELSDILKRSHLFVSVSLSDGNNISLNEAMACGVVCIATDIPANRQWIRDGENGFLVPVNAANELSDKILLACANYNDLSSKFIPANTKIISEKADWKKNMDAVEKQYIRLVSQK